jgi:outer membrane immunogenic protein
LTRPSYGSEELNVLGEGETKRFALLMGACFAATHALAVGITQPAVELPVAVAAPASPSFSWTGFCAGVSATSVTASDGEDDYDTSGFGAQVGYLHDLRSFGAGGELAYSDADLNISLFPASITATRLKLIGGYDAGRFLPYVFVGSSRLTAPGDRSDLTTNYGLGGRVALGAEGWFVAGLDYIVEDKGNGDGEFDLDRQEVSLRINDRF